MPGEEHSQTRRTPEECCPAPDVLSAWLDETLDAARRPEIEAHVESCERCQEILERQTRLSGFSERAAALCHPGGLVEAEQMHDVLEKIKQLDHETETELDEPDRALNSLAPSDYPGALGRLGRFEVLSVLGWGGMGTVYRAFDPTLNRVVAVKVLAPHLAHRPVARRRFIREAQAAAAICHEHVVTIHGIDESPEHPMIIMQYVPGRSLQDHLNAEGFLELREILRIGRQTAAGLAAAHAQGLVHRDIKPANILLENGVQRVRLRDAGIVVGPTLMLAAAGAIIEAAASADGVALLLAVVYLTWLLLTFLQTRIHGSCFASVHLMLWCVAGFAVLVDAAILIVILNTTAAAIPVLMVTAAVGIAVVSFCRSVGEQAGLLPAAGLFNPERMATESGGVGSPANPVSDFPNMASDDMPGRAGRASSPDSISAARPPAAAAPPAIPEFVRGASSQAVVTHRRAPFRAGILWAKLFAFPALASVLLILRLQRGSWEWSGNGVLHLQSFVALSGFLYLTLIGSAWCLVANSDGGFRRTPGVVRTPTFVAIVIASTGWAENYLDPLILLKLVMPLPVSIVNRVEANPLAGLSQARSKDQVLIPS